MDCKNNKKCDTCKFNKLVDERVKGLKQDVEYSITVKDGTETHGSDKYVYFLENHCFIVGVCELYKKENNMTKEQLIQEIMRVRPNLYSVSKLEVKNEEWLMNKLNELRG